MSERSDSLNCVDAVYESSDFPPAPPGPRSAAYEAHIRREQELVRRAGGVIPPPGVVDVTGSPQDTPVPRT